MNFVEVIELVSFFGGMLVHFILMGQLARRRRKKKSGILFFGLMLSVGVWHFGNFATHFLHSLFGPHNIDVNLLISFFSIFVVAGLILIPSVLIHTLVTFFFEKELNFNKKIQPWIQWGIYLIYFPVLFFPIIVTQLFERTTRPYGKVLSGYIFPFKIWVIACLVMAAFLCLKLSRVGWEKEERNLFFSMAFTFFFIVAIVGFLVYARFQPWVVYNNFFLLVISLLPTMVFAYYVYKYNYMDFVIRRGILYTILITTIVLLYLLGVEKLTHYFGERYEINPGLIQSLLILALVFAFRPFRTHTAEMLDRFFFKEHEIYKEVYRDLTQQIRGGRVRDMPALLRHIVEALKKKLELEHASLVFFERRGENLHITASTLPFDEGDFSHIIEYTESQKLKVINRYDVGNEEVLQEMDNLGAFIVIPIYSDQELIGLFNLGKKKSNRRIHSDELEMLILLSSQLATEIQNMQLLEEKIRLERELLKNEKFLALGRLSASVAHQVKNPLSSIKIITQVLKEDLPPGDHREEDLALVINEIDKLAKVVNQLLEFAKPAKQETHQSDLERVLDEVVMLMQYEANRYKVKINKDIQDEIPPLRADRMILHDIFSNLIQNSIQALEKEGGEIEIRTHSPPLPYEEEEMDGEKMITVEIKDSGQGIPEENLEHIFEPFYTTKQQGTGLGLPIVKQRLENMGGKVQIESKTRGEGEKNNSGTTVYLWLPLV